MQTKSQQTRPRWRAAAVLGLLAAASLARAAEFDEKIRSPRVTNPADLHTEAGSFAAKVAQLRATAPEALATDADLSAERFDLEWKIQRAIDQNQALGDLSIIGLESRDDGFFRIDLARNPQWLKLDEYLAGVLPQSNWATLSPQLIARGFRESDVAIVQGYVSKHDAAAEGRQRSLPLEIGFSRFVKKLDKLKRPVTDDIVLAFLYQRDKALSAARHDWTLGLLGALDAQRGRVLLSYFGETGGTAVWAPSDQRAGIADVLASVRRPDFERLITEQSQGATP